MSQINVKQLYKDYLTPCYGMTDLVPAKAQGIKMWDVDGKEYLDFFPGWGVSSIGHAHPAVAAALREQAQKILHIQNNYYNQWQALLGERIIKASFPGKVLFTNSGAEANEVAIKIARRYGNPGRHEIITMNRAFHGRTLGTLAATGQAKHQKGFEPIPVGFTGVPFNDIDAVKQAITGRTIAVMLEVVQGEGGINVAGVEYMKELRALTREKDILLIVDEVQTGLGRTGTMFAYQRYDIEPDIMCLAKAIGGGFPIAATVAVPCLADLMQPGSHGSTYGGSPLACVSALAAFDVMDTEGLLANTVEQGTYFKEQLNKLAGEFPALVKEVRGTGLMLGMELTGEGADMVAACMEKGLLINCTQLNILRLMPPLSVQKEEIDKAVAILTKVFAEKKV